MNQTELTPTAVQNEVSGWTNYLNEVIGVLCFTLGLASLGTGNPPLYASLSFIFVVIFHLPNFKKNAKILNYLRTKKDLNEFEKYVLKDLLSKIQIKNLLLSIYGYVFLFLVSSGWYLFKGNTQIVALIYGA